MRRLGIVMGAVLLLSGCASAGTSSPGAGPSTSPTATALAEPGTTKPLTPITAAEVTEYCPQDEASHFDGDTDAVTDVYVCTTETIMMTGGGTEPATVQRASRVVGGVDALLEAYAVENAAVAADIACIEMLADPAIVWLVTSDGTVPVYAPVDVCGFPTDDSSAAYQALELETLVEIRSEPSASDTPDD